MLHFFKGLCLGRGAGSGAGDRHALALGGPSARLVRVFFFLLGAVVHLFVFLIIVVVVWFHILQQPGLACLGPRAAEIAG